MACLMVALLLDSSLFVDKCCCMQQLPSLEFKQEYLSDCWCNHLPGCLATGNILHTHAAIYQMHSGAIICLVVAGKQHVAPFTDAVTHEATCLWNMLKHVAHPPCCWCSHLGASWLPGSWKHDFPAFAPKHYNHTCFAAGAAICLLAWLLATCETCRTFYQMPDGVIRCFLPGCCQHGHV